MGNKYIVEILNEKNLFELLQYKIKDKFKVEEILNAEVLKEIGLEDAIVYNFDSVDTDNIENIKIEIENIIEARFFNDKSEIRLFRDEDKISGTIFMEKENTPFIEKNVLLYPRDKKARYPNKLKFKKYLDYDQDNQAYIRYTKPCKLYFKEGR